MFRPLHKDDTHTLARPNGYNQLVSVQEKMLLNLLGHFGSSFEAKRSALFVGRFVGRIGYPLKLERYAKSIGIALVDLEIPLLLRIVAYLFR